MRKYKVRVINTQVRDVPVHAYIYDERRGHIKTGKVIRVDKVERKTVMFSGSPEAYRIWREGHSLPATATVKEGPIKDEDLLQ